MKKQDYRVARDHFARELARNEGNAELHYWFGMASLALGDSEQARRHLMMAMKSSPEKRDREIYTAKLEQLKRRLHD
jgi:tetratricopeptide (TPR) repeat protein